MKGILIVLMLALAGCSGFVSLEELEAQALVTGDWTEVEKRERIIAKRKLRTALACPPGTMGFCDVSWGKEKCGCVETEIISSLLDY